MPITGLLPLIHEAQVVLMQEGGVAVVAGQFTEDESTILRTNLLPPGGYLETKRLGLLEVAVSDAEDEQVLDGPQV